jgi:rod shape-determining protein MreC
MQYIKFIISAILAIIIMILDYRLNAFESLKTGIKFIMTPVYKTLDFPGSVYDYLNTSNNNKQYIKELLILKNKVNNYNSLLLENQRLSQMLEASYTIVDASFVLARITDIKQSRLRKHIVIDKGSDEGVVDGLVVISSNGVVGRVIQSNYGYSVVRLITDPLSYIPVLNTRSGERGVAKGIADTSGNLIIKHIRPDADISIGDIWTTSGKGGVFTKHFQVGKVIDIKQNNNNFIDIILSPMQHINQTVFTLVKLPQ